MNNNNLEVIVSRFNSISDIIIDPFFKEFVSKNIDELRKNRINRPLPKPGYYYKRGWYERMTEQGMLNTRYFLENIELIWNKKSSIPSALRQIIKYVCDKSFQETLLRYANESTELNNKIKWNQNQ
jgi:hypothetical protein